MADTTIVNTPAGRNVDSADSAVGWVIAAIVLIAILIGGFFLLRRANVGGAAVPGTNVEVSLPSGSGATGGTGAGSGGSGGGTGY